MWDRGVCARCRLRTCWCLSGRACLFWACALAPVLECQLVHTYPLFPLASFPLPFFYFNVLPPLSPPGLKPTRAAVHSKKRSEPFFSIILTISPWRHCLHSLPPPSSSFHSCEDLPDGQKEEIHRQEARMPCETFQGFNPNDMDYHSHGERDNYSYFQPSRYFSTLSHYYAWLWSHLGPFVFPLCPKQWAPQWKLNSIWSLKHKR